MEGRPRTSATLPRLAGHGVCPPPLALATCGALGALLVLAACGTRGGGGSDLPAGDAAAHRGLGAASRQGGGARTAASDTPRTAAGAVESGRRFVFRGLLADAARAELDDGGLVIDLGTADQHKYTRGGWLTGWGSPRVDASGTSVCDVIGRTAKLAVLVVDGRVPQEAWVRARSDVPGQRVEVSIDGVKAGGGSVGPSFAWVKVPVRGLRPGWREIDLAFQKGQAVRAEVDLVWLRAGGEQPVIVPRVMPLRLQGGTRRTLAVPRPRSYAFFLEVPKGAALRFEYGARAAMEFFVRVAADDAPGRELFREKSAPQEWRRAEVDLAAFSGKVVRLELGASGDGGPGGFAEPEIVAAATPVLENAQGGPAVPPDRGRTPAKNAVIIVMDAVRADALSAYEPKARAPSPAFDAIAREGTLFRRAYASANWTKPQATTLVTGLYQQTHNVRFRLDRLSPDVETIATRLRAAGFRTALFTGNPHFGKAFGFERGWDLLRDYKENQPDQAAWERKVEASQMFEDALRWIEENRGSRFLAYLHTMGAHAPYRPRPGCTPDVGFQPRPFFKDGVLPIHIIGMNLGNITGMKDHDYAWFRALYEGELACHDKAMATFVAGLGRLGLLDDTIVVVTADHGEELNEHGLLGHSYTLYEPEVRVPLAMRHPPQFPPGSRTDEFAESVDLYPTVMEALGLPPPQVDGLSLLPITTGQRPMQPSYAVFEHTLGYRARGIRIGPHKLVAVDGELVPPDPKPAPGQKWLPKVMAPGDYLFDVGRDPGETRNLIAEAPIARRHAMIYFGEALAIPAKGQREAGMATRPGHRPGRAVIDPALRRQLEALGYLGQ